jgi:hypothetical protein
VKTKGVLARWILPILCVSSAFAQTEQTPFSVLKGPYLGQKPPGRTPEIFAPGLISTDRKELNSAFTPDAREFYFSIRESGSGYRMLFTKETQKGWTQPELVPFSSTRSDVDMCITQDGKRMYFGSTRPVNGKRQSDFKIWYVDRIGDGWSQAKYLDAPVNEGKRALYPTFSDAGTMFFQAIRDDTFGSRDIYYSTQTNGQFSEPVHLGREINSVHGEGDVLIAPDESYIIVNCVDRSDGLGSGDLYISFKQKNGEWAPLKNMGAPINSPYSDYCPMLSPDGKYLFFTSGRTGDGDIYWVDSGVIQTMRPE